MAKITLKGLGMPLLATSGILFAAYMVFMRPEYLPRDPVTPPPHSKFSSQVAGIGVVEPSTEIISINPDLPGLVRKIHVKVGDVVKMHTPLITLDQRDVDAQISTLKASLSSAKIQAEDADTQYKLLKSVTDLRAISRDDLNRRRFAAELAQSKVSEIKAQLQQAETTKERLTITAPVDGTVLSLNARPGEYAASTGVADPIIRMGDISTLHVRVDFDEENAVKINSTNLAEGSFRGTPTSPVALKFVRFEPYVRPKQNLQSNTAIIDTRVLQVIYAIDSSHLSNTPAIFVGQQMDVFVDTESKAEQKAESTPVPMDDEPTVTGSMETIKLPAAIPASTGSKP